MGYDSFEVMISMLIAEVCRITGLTKKAVEYYVDQGMVSPESQENGYRDFQDSDVEQLKKIRVLRMLGLRIDEIKTALLDQSGTVLKKLAIQKLLTLRQDRLKNEMLDRLSSGDSYESVSAKLSALDQNRAISERLLDKFPGSYGRFLCLHFAHFLNEPIRSDEQRTAFQCVVDFLDQMPPLDFPDDVQAFFEESTEQIDAQRIEKMLEGVRESMCDIESFVHENKDALEQYAQYRQSDEYKSSAACRLRHLLRKFSEASGYYDVFIPAMAKLSPSYAAYREQMEVANEKMLFTYPEFAKFDECE